MALGARHARYGQAQGTRHINERHAHTDICTPCMPLVGPGARSAPLCACRCAAAYTDVGAGQWPIHPRALNHAPAPTQTCSFLQSPWMYLKVSSYVLGLTLLVIRAVNWAAWEQRVSMVRAVGRP